MVDERIPPTIRPEHPTPVSVLEAATSVGLEIVGDAAGVMATGITNESRVVRAGDVFAALPGRKTHGADYVDAAATAGAVAILTDRDGLERASATGLPVILAENPRAVLGALSAELYRTAGNRALVFGVTGTNGKTTTVHVLEAILRQLGHVTGLSSTAERHIAGEVVVARLTTPESSDLHALLARMEEQGVTAAAIEVSAQGLSNHRLDGVVFDAVGFTNLSIDHMDDYGTMDRYFEAKQSLFTPERATAGVSMVDTEWGARMFEGSGIPTASLSSDPAVEADWMLVITGTENDRTFFTLTHRDGRSISTSVALLGSQLVADAGLAIAMLDAAGIPLETIDASIGRGIDVYIPGRTEKVSGERGPKVFVDFGHSSDAFEKTLAAVRTVTEKRVIMVFGADGDRDPAKRPEMARVAAAGADVVVITDHHPRFEDPQSIRTTLMTAATSHFPDKHIVEVSPPEKAIEYAVGIAEEGDSILWAGPGHQDYRDIRGVRTPYSARALAREQLAKRGWTPA